MRSEKLLDDLFNRCHNVFAAVNNIWSWIWCLEIGTRYRIRIDNSLLHYPTSSVLFCSELRRMKSSSKMCTRRQNRYYINLTRSNNSALKINECFERGEGSMTNIQFELKIWFVIAVFTGQDVIVILLMKRGSFRDAKRNCISLCKALIVIMNKATSATPLRVSCSFSLFLEDDLAIYSNM